MTATRLEGRQWGTTRIVAMMQAKGRCQCLGQCLRHKGKCGKVGGQSRLFDREVDQLVLISESRRPRAPQSGAKLSVVPARMVCEECAETWSYETAADKRRRDQALTEESRTRTWQDVVRERGTRQ